MVCWWAGRLSAGMSSSLRLVCSVLQCADPHVVTPHSPGNAFELNLAETGDLQHVWPLIGANPPARTALGVLEAVPA
jgi:hypothetical protein